MIFSGSVVVDSDNTSGFCREERGERSCLVAVYTGHGRGKQTQNLAFSNDRGRTWTKYARNPVIDLGLENFRDPKAFWHEASRRWVLVTVLADQHKVRFFGSPDLKRWAMLYSSFTPTRVMSACHLAVSSFSNAANSAGLLNTTSDPSLSRELRNAGSFRLSARTG